MPSPTPWLVDDFRVAALCPLTGTPGNRSGEALWALVQLFHVDTAERYTPKDVTGDGKDETFCNVFVSDVTRALGCGVPHGLLANQQVAWLKGRRDWWVVEETEAALRALCGFPVVAAWANPEATRPGHVAVLVPPPERLTGLWVAQAGALRTSRTTLGLGFGTRPVTLFTHN